MNLVIDLGGSNTRVALFNNEGTLTSVEKFKTNTTFPEQKERIGNSIRKQAEDLDITKVCIGVPGTVDLHKNLIISCANIPYLDNKNVLELLPEKFTNEDVLLVNDAAIAGLGEAIHGSGINFNTIAYITVSTGVGGARIHGKKIDTTQDFFEPGHHIIAVYKDEKVTHTTFEDLASGKNFVGNFGIEPQNCSDTKIWMEYGKTLALGLINVTAFWAPEAIVIGGGLSNQFDLFIQHVINEFPKRTRLECPKIVKSKLGDDSGLYGGNEFIKQHGFLV